MSFLKAALLHLVLTTFCCAMDRVDPAATDAICLTVYNNFSQIIDTYDTHEVFTTIFPKKNRNFMPHINDSNSLKFFVRFGDHYHLRITKMKREDYAIAYIYIREAGAISTQWHIDRKDIAQSYLSSRGQPYHQELEVTFNEKGVPYFSKS